MSRPTVRTETYRSPLIIENDQKSLSMKPQHIEDRSIQSSKLLKFDIVDPPTSRRTASTRKSMNPKLMSILPDGEFEKAFLCEKEENEDEDFEAFERAFLNRPPIKIQFKKKTKPNIVTPSFSRQSTRRYKNNGSQKQKPKEEEQKESESKLSNQAENQTHDQEAENNFLEDNFLNQPKANNFSDKQAENQIRNHETADNFFNQQTENNFVNQPNDEVKESPRKPSSLKISKQQEIDAIPAPDPHLSEFNFSSSRSPRAVYNVAKKQVVGASKTLQKPKPPPMSFSERSKMLRKRNQERAAKRKAKQESMKMEELQARRIAPYKAANLSQKVKTSKEGLSKLYHDDDETESSDDFGENFQNKLLDEIVIGITDDDQIWPENDHHTLIKSQKIENKPDDWIFNNDSDEINEIPVLNTTTKNDDDCKSDTFDDNQIAPESENAGDIYKLDSFSDTLTKEDKNAEENQNKSDAFDNQITPESENEDEIYKSDNLNDALTTEDKSEDENQNDSDTFDNQITPENTDEIIIDEDKADENEVKNDLNEDVKTHEKEPETEIQNIASSIGKELIISSDNEKQTINNDFEEEIHAKPEENEEIKKDFDNQSEPSQKENHNNDEEIIETIKNEEENKEINDKNKEETENIDENRNEIDKNDAKIEDENRDDIKSIDNKEETENIDENKEEIENINTNDNSKEEAENIGKNDETKERTENIDENTEIKDEIENRDEIQDAKSKDEVENEKDENKDETKDDEIKEDDKTKFIENKEQVINNDNNEEIEINSTRNNQKDIKSEANKSKDDDNIAENHENDKSIIKKANENDSINTKPLSNAAQNELDQRNSSLYYRIKLIEQQARLQERNALEEAREAKAQVQEINKRITEAQLKAQEAKQRAKNAKEEAQAVKEQLMKAKQMMKLYKQALEIGEISSGLQIESKNLLQDQNKEIQTKNNKENIKNQQISLPESTQCNQDELNIAVKKQKQCKNIQINGTEKQNLNPKVELNAHSGIVFDDDGNEEATNNCNLDKAMNTKNNVSANEKCENDYEKELLMQSEEIFGTSSSTLMEIKDNEEIQLIRAKCEEIGENVNILLYESSPSSQFEEEEEEADSDLWNIP